MKQKWKCIKCGHIETPPLAIQEATHQCNPAVKRWYDMKLVSEETNELQGRDMGSEIRGDG